MEPSCVWHGERDEGERDAGSIGGSSDGMEDFLLLMRREHCRFGPRRSSPWISKGHLLMKISESLRRLRFLKDLLCLRVEHMKPESMIEVCLLQDKRLPHSHWERRSKMSLGISAAAADDDGEEGEEEAGVVGRRGRGWQGSNRRCIGSGTCCGRTTSYASRGSRATSPTSSLAGSSTPVCSTSPSKSSSSTASRACRRWASSGSLEVRLTYWRSSMKCSEFHILDRMSNLCRVQKIVCF